LRNSKGRAAPSATGKALGGAHFRLARRPGLRLLEHGDLGELRQHVAHQLAREGLQVGLELARVELAERRLEDEGLDPHLARAQPQRLVEALRHHQHGRAQVHLPEPLHHLEAALERRAPRGRHAEVGHQHEELVLGAQARRELGGLLGISALDNLEAGRAEVAGEHLSHVLLVVDQQDGARRARQLRGGRFRDGRSRGRRLRAG
jgi:hypothetical protein